MNAITITFNFGGIADVTQTLEIIDEWYTEEYIIGGLNSGDIVTSISYDQSNPQGAVVLNVSENKIIGHVVAQEIAHDVSYTDFQLVTEE